MRITHVLADGTVKTDISGHVVKVSEAEHFYEKLHSINRRMITNGRTSDRRIVNHEKN